jgi:hypothetical protein
MVLAAVCLKAPDQKHLIIEDHVSGILGDLIQQ